MKNIFEQIIASSGTSQYSRDKKRRSEWYRQQELDHSKKEFFDIYQGIAPYVGIGSRAISHGETDLLNMEDVLGEFKSGLNYWLSTEDNIREIQKKGIKLIRCQYASGQVVWSGDVGLIFKVHPKVFHGFNIIDGWRVPTLSWVVESLSNFEFFDYLHPSRDSYLKYNKLEEQRKEKEAEERFLKQVEETKAQMAKEGFVVNDVTYQIYKFFKTYDYYYEYSDDHKYAMMYRAKDRLARSLAMEHDPKLLSLLDQKVI